MINLPSTLMTAKKKTLTGEKSLKTFPKMNWAKASLVVVPLIRTPTMTRQSQPKKLATMKKTTLRKSTIMSSQLTSEEFTSIYAKVPRLCVDVIIKEGDSVLLTRRTLETYKNLWHIPGGTVTFGETPSDAVKRIALAELGLEVEILSLIDVVAFRDEFKGDWHGWPITLEYQVQVISGEIELNEDADRFAYFDKYPRNTIIGHKKLLTEKLGLQEDVAEK